MDETIDPALPIEIDVHAFRALQQTDPAVVLLDVREQDEYATARIEGAVLLPMSELAERVGELEAYRQRRLVVHCHHGGRSLHVVQQLRKAGFAQAQNLTGGIDVWSQQIDPEVPRY